jgi:Fe2+ or Zn2+ uptake regulation protein
MTRPVKTEIRFDILDTISKTGQFDAENIKELALKHDCGIRNIRRVLNLMISQGMIKRTSFIICDSGKAFFETHKGDAE